MKKKVSFSRIFRCKPLLLLLLWIQSAWAGPAVVKYGVFEQALISTMAHANKFTDVTLTVTVTPPSGSDQTFEGFYDGDGAGGQNGNVWKFRYMPTQAGLHTYTTSSTDAQLDGKSGDFTACPHLPTTSSRNTATW